MAYWSTGLEKIRKKIFISNFRVFSVFRFFDPVPEKLYFFWFSTGEWPPAGPRFPLLREGWGILGDRVRPPSKLLIDYLVKVSYLSLIHI